MGGDCQVDVDRLRTQPDVFGTVTSNLTVSRLLKALSDDAPAVLAAVNTVRAQARARVWEAAEADSPVHDTSAEAPLAVDLDATVVTSHSENKEQAAPTYKRGFRFHPLASLVDHGAGGTGEPLAMLLRPGNARSNTVADHITVTDASLAQLPPGHRTGRAILVRTATAVGTHGFLDWLTDPVRDLAYSVGFGFPAMDEALGSLDKDSWVKALNSDGIEGDGVWVTELYGHLDLSSWPAGMRVIVRRRNPTSVRSCASPTSTGCATPRSRRTRQGTIWPGRKSHTVCGPAARTGSATARTPAWPTSRSKRSPGTRFGPTW